MKKIVVFSLIVLFLSCADSETKISGPSTTAQIVIESFYEKDEETLKANSTPEGYANYMNIINMFNATKKKDSDFKVLQDTIMGDVAWVKYTTAYDKTPGVFKLVKQDGKWLATARGSKDKAPF
ncbi:MAG: hypothetical protein CMP12_11335 [Zunongwangia sp.]|uniref:hypothetical protein n=1 Tax=Zunongwangia profunda TaxID=398743 RepID=UPI000C5C9250|nr:hypothetical protein [Zunongwangia profunda]MAO36476.1 hypothetical protein [Zunongwangia sp.]MBG44875.1 hypothetical protein [Aequorivita sp.]|tara:strand:+ start:39371 stop:39742 length:372 start_codon:yes stop_codon:yes gene_type:complete